MLLAADAGEAFAKTSEIAAVAAPKREASSIALPVALAICCSLPFGIAAMLFSLRGRAALAEGDGDRARRAKRYSTLFSWASIAWTAFVIVAFLLLTTG